MSAIEYLLRVRPADDGTFAASIRQLAGASHPEVRAVVGPVAFGRGDNAAAAMVHAISNAKLTEMVEIHRVS